MYGNKITVVGNLTKDPELKYLPTGKAVINFTVACNHGWRDRETQSWVHGESVYFKIEGWDTLDENISETLRKGDPVIVVGRMTCRTYEQEGKAREAWEVKADTVAPDLRRRAASLRRIVRSGPLAEPVASPDMTPPDIIQEPDLDDVDDVDDVQHAEAVPSVSGLAVAS